MKNSQKGSLNSNWKGGLIKRECLVCNSNFEAKRKTIRNGGGKYCSRHCVYIGISKERSINARKNQIKKTCQVCGNHKYVRKSRTKTEGTYCSKQCQAIGYKNKLKGELNPNYRHGESNTKEYYVKHRIRWRKLNIEKSRAYVRNYFAKKRNAKGSHTREDIVALYVFQKGKCVVCKVSLSNSYHVDHITPLSLNGSNDKGNLQLLCPSCNMSKSNKDPILFMQSRGFLL